MAWRTLDPETEDFTKLEGKRLKVDVKGVEVRFTAKRNRLMHTSRLDAWVAGAPFTLQMFLLTNTQWEWENAKYQVKDDAGK